MPPTARYVFRALNPGAGKRGGGEEESLSPQSVFKIVCRAVARVTKTNTTSGKTTTYISDLLNLEADQEKLAFYANGLKLATLEQAGTPSTPECTIPATGDWTVTADCTITSFKTVSGNITINPAVTLTISPTGVLTLDLHTNKLLVKDTAKLIIKQGGAVAQTGTIPSPLPGGTQGGLGFHHPDHLSSAGVDTDTQGNIVQLTDYYPFGDSRIEETTGAFHNDYTYTGKERDEDTELLYYEARYYDSHLGRFISLDPWGGDIKDPQSFNKYAYVRNNPLKYVDPDGRSYVGFTDEEVAFYERVYMGQFIGPLTLEQSKKLEMYKMQRSLKQAMANMAKFDGILFDMMESEEEKERENYAANYDQLLSGAEKNTFTDQDFLNHAKLLDKTAQEGVGGIVGLAGGSKGAKVVGEKITGYTKHGINRAISKDNVGVKTSAIVDALRNPVKTIQQTGNRMVMIGKDAVVVLNKAGKVITTRATNRNGQRNPR